MEAKTSSPTRVDTRSLLLPYALALVVAMVVVQAVIALTGGDITPLAGILTAVVALGIAGWLVLNRRALMRVRFGQAVAHAIAFAVVTTSFNAHAALRAVTAGSASPEAAGADLFGTGWFGATLVMSAAWGLGLVVHLLGAVLGRGWED